MLASSWFAWLENANEGVLIVGLVCLAGMVIGVTACITHSWQRVRRSENRTVLIGMLLQRNLSASEIQGVLQAAGESGLDDGDGSPEVRIISLMKENEYSGDDVERVLDAARHNGRIDEGAFKVVEALVEQEAKVGEIESLLEARHARGAAVRI